MREIRAIRHLHICQAKVAGAKSFQTKINLCFDEIFIVEVKDEDDPDVRKLFQIEKRIFRVVEPLGHRRDVDQPTGTRRDGRLSGRAVLGRMTRLDEADWTEQEIVRRRRQLVTSGSSRLRRLR